MRVFPRVSQPTLDSFRKDIYRPRLALLLLILLLSGNEPRHAEGQVDNVAIHSLASGQRIADKRRLNGAMSQSYSARDNVRAEASSSFLTLDRIPFIAALHRDTTSGQKRRQQWKSSRGGAVAPEKLTGSSDSKRKSTRRSSSTNPSITTSLLPRALFRLPKLSWRVLIEGNALSAVVPLHMLWLVRLGGMMVEDTINRQSPSTSRRPPLPRLVAHGPVLVKVGGLTLLAIAALFLSSTSTLRNCVLALQGDSSLPDLFPSSSTLPLRLIVFLEFSATLLSLLSPLVKLNNPRLSRRLPGTIFLPSPSHAPPVVDLLPLPPGLADILSGRASDMQSRNGRRGPFRGSRTNTVRHGVIQGLALVPEAAEEHQRGRQEDRWAGGLQDPLTLPTEQSHEGTGLAANGKAPRRRGLQVQVDSNWLLENVVILWGYLVGAIEYLVVTLSLPTLSPTSLPPILALLSLRSQLGALVVTWISARRSLECLEFVRRRWPSSSLSLAETSPRWRADEEEEILCPICLEPIQSESGEEAAPFGAESCLLDCGHKLHAVCLVQIFLGTKQAFCPCCHDPLKATPPTAQVAHASSLPTQGRGD